MPASPSNDIPVFDIPVFAPNLKALVRAIFERAGWNDRDAALAADHLVLANLSGHDSHGVGMVPRYMLAAAKGLLKKGAVHAGYANDLWTCRRVADLIGKSFGVSYDPDHVWRILHSLGWTAQKPEARARERDEAAIQRWRKKDWPRIKKTRGG